MHDDVVAEFVIVLVTVFDKEISTDLLIIFSSIVTLGELVTVLDCVGV